MDNSWSDTVSLQGPRGRKRGKQGVTGPAVETRVNFRLAGGVRTQVAGSPIRVTWTSVGHQAINGLDEGVFYCTVWDLCAKG